MLIKGEKYTDHGQEYLVERYRKRALFILRCRAQQLGMTLVPNASAPKAA
jgi:hypothetical protein